MNCLLIHSIDDDTSTVANAEVVHNRIGSTVKRKIFIDDCYHIITMDNERELVARETRWFFEEVSSTPLHGHSNAGFTADSGPSLDDAVQRVIGRSGHSWWVRGEKAAMSAFGKRRRPNAPASRRPARAHWCSASRV